MNKGKVTSQIPLDLSAAFDKVDYKICLHQLEHWFCLSCPAISWFTSNLHPLTRAIHINQHKRCGLDETVSKRRALV